MAGRAQRGLLRRRRARAREHRAGVRPLDHPATGLEALIFFAVLAACVFAMWRVWRDEHTYGY